jgi:outer membrane protein insertion porin family
MNNGYLFSNVTPVEKSVNGDAVNLEIRINEGEKATWNKVTWQEIQQPMTTLFLEL